MKAGTVARRRGQPHTGGRGRRVRLLVAGVARREERRILRVLAESGVAVALTRCHTAAKLARERLITELREALASLKTLRGLIPICSACKKIRDDRGYWRQVEGYVRAHSEAVFSHGLCGDCARRLYPEYSDPEEQA